MIKKYIAIEHKNSRYCKGVPYISKKEFKNLYIKYSVQLSMIKNSLIKIQEMLKHSNDVEKQEIYKKIKQEIKKNINPLIIQIVLDSNTIVSNYEKYVEDKNNAIHQLTKNELENKTLFNVSNYEMEINKLKKKYVKKNKNRTRPSIHVDEIYEYDIQSTEAELDACCKSADFVFHLAGVNRPENPEDFMRGNFGFTSKLLDTLKKYGNKATIMLSSSVQATLAGRFGDSEYGRSKKAGEELFFQYARETGAKVAVYRFPNLMGHSRPKYNSAVSTFCWAVANDEEFTVNDRATELELLYIDDLIEGMFDLMEGKEQRCEFDGVDTVLKDDGRYCCVPVTHKVTLGEIVDLLQEFKQQPVSLLMPEMPEGSFAKKLFSLYLTYLPTEKFKYQLKMNEDSRGSFTELIHTVNCANVDLL